MTEATTAPIALALSGGGVRAMVFHLGVLKYLAEKGMLERVEKISTVSGGSLILGLILQEGDLKWPNSKEFLESIYPKLEVRLCSRSLFRGAVRQLLNPLNLRFALSRANLLALALKREWGISHRLADLPTVPEWSINGTTAENGKRFRFKRDGLGDYLVGYAEPENYPLANALAVSAAVPGGFGPLSLPTKSFTWKFREFGAPVENTRVIEQPYSRLHLYDGGVYDNLGLEPFFDAGKGIAKPKAMPIIVSDAGAPLSDGMNLGPLNPFRLLRIVAMMGEQSRSLRVRSFAKYLQDAPGRGAYIYIKTNVGEAPHSSTQLACAFPTSLQRLTLDDFQMLANHGYAVAKKVDIDFGLLSSNAVRAIAKEKMPSDLPIQNVEVATVPGVQSPNIENFQIVSETLRELNLAEDKHGVQTRNTKASRVLRLFRYLGVFLPLAAATILGIAVLFGFESYRWPALNALFLVIITATTYSLAEIAVSVMPIRRNMGDPLKKVYESSNLAANHASIAIEKLKMLPISDLKFSLEILKSRGDEYDARLKAIAGLVKNVGVLPSMTVALATAATALSQPHQSPLQWVLGGLSLALVLLYPAMGHIIEKINQFERGLAMLSYLIEQLETESSTT